MSAQKSAVRQDDQGIKDALFFDALDECLVACVTVEGGVDRMGLDAIDWPLFGQVAGQCRGLIPRPYRGRGVGDTGIAGGVGVLVGGALLGGLFVLHGLVLFVPAVL